MAEQGLALVTGATGAVGSAVARALLTHGWQVRGLARDPAQAALHGVPGIDWRRGDAMIEADVVAAAAGAGLLVHGVNPPRYRNWRGLAIPMLRHAITAARASQARLILPGNIYNFAPDAGPRLRETTPMEPRTRKGAVRVEMEAMLRESGVRALVVRAGDYFGAPGRSSWFNAMVTPGKPLRAVMDPCAPGVGHGWAYLPDLAETIARLAAMEEQLPVFETVHFAGHWLAAGEGMAQAIRRASGDPSLPIRRFPWAVVYLGAPFVPFLRELIEMRYLWRTPQRLDNARLVALLGEEPHTALDVAVTRSLQALGCLPASGERGTARPDTVSAADISLETRRAV